MTNVKVLVFFLSITSLTAFAEVFKRGPEIIDGNYFFNDHTKERNRSQAIAYCVSFDAELAKITGRSYRLVTLKLPALGSYWIDGIDKMSAERFEVSKKCIAAGDGKVSFTGIPKANLDLPAVSCLSVVKGISGATTKIQAVDCNSVLKGVICSYPANGCDDQPEPENS